MNSYASTIRLEDSSSNEGGTYTPAFLPASAFEFHQRKSTPTMTAAPRSQLTELITTKPTKQHRCQLIKNNPVKMMEGSDSEAPSSMETQAVNCKFFTSCRADLAFFQPVTTVSWCLSPLIHHCHFMASERLEFIMGACDNIIVMHSLEPLLCRILKRKKSMRQAGEALQKCIVLFYRSYHTHSHRICLLCPR